MFMKVLRMLVMASGGAALALALAVFPASAHDDGDIGTDDTTFNHLKCYQIKDKSLKAGGYTFRMDAHHLNLLQAQTNSTNCRLKVSADMLCVDTRTADVKDRDQNDPPFDNDAPPLGTIPNAWDYVCYKVNCDRPSQPLPGTTVTVKDRFGERLVIVKRTRKLCVPILDKY
jgi:hypothetical protein